MDKFENLREKLRPREPRRPEKRPTGICLDCGRVGPIHQHHLNKLFPETIPLCPSCHLTRHATARHTILEPRDFYSEHQYEMVHSLLSEETARLKAVDEESARKLRVLIQKLQDGIENEAEKKRAEIRAEFCFRFGEVGPGENERYTFISYPKPIGTFLPSRKDWGGK